MKDINLTTAKRESYFDNAKAILIFLVIFGHVIEKLIYDEGDNIFKSIYQFIYLFHMPCFVFISGYFSKQSITVKDALSRFIAPLIVFHIFYYVLLYFLDIKQFKTKEFLTVPFHILWYLLSMFFWSMILKFISDKYIKLLIVIAGLLAVAIGCFSFIERPFALSRTIYFFPFFLTGYYFSKNNYLSLLKTAPFKKIFYLFVLTVICGICFMYGAAVPVKMLYGHTPYHSLDFGNYMGMAMRTCLLLLSVVCGFCFLKLIPSEKTFLSVFGARTLQIYLLHDITIQLLLFYHAFEQTTSPALILLYAFGISVLTFLLTSLTFLGNLLKKITSVSRLILSAPASARR